MKEPIVPEDILTPAELAERLKVKTSWVFEQTRSRNAKKNKHPFPVMRMGKLLRFHWPDVSAWLIKENSN
jgi:hypothetical protein